MADQTLTEHAARRDDATFRSQVSAALEREILDVVRGRGAWSADAPKVADYARSVLSNSVARQDAIEMCVRVAAADLVSSAVLTDTLIVKAVRRALRFRMDLSQEA